MSDEFKTRRDFMAWITKGKPVFVKNLIYNLETNGDGLIGSDGCSFYDICQAIKYFEMFKKQATKHVAWEESLKEKPRLCYVWDGDLTKKLAVVCEYEANAFYKYRDLHNCFQHAIPLTNDEIEALKV